MIAITLLDIQTVMRHIGVVERGKGVTTMARYEVTTFDVCQPGFERLRNRDEFLLVSDVRRRMSKRALTAEFLGDIQACERPEGFDYAAADGAVRAFIARLDMQRALLYVEGGCRAFLYLRDNEAGDDI